MPKSARGRGVKGTTKRSSPYQPSNEAASGGSNLKSKGARQAKRKSSSHASQQLPDEASGTYDAVSVEVPQQNIIAATPVVRPTNNSGERLQTTTPVNTALRVGLTVGISLGLGILGVLLMFGVTVSARKKGYLRHTPGSYSIFGNERTTYDAIENSLHI